MNAGQFVSTPVEVRFWAKVDKRSESECWSWLAGKLPTGYGMFRGVGSEKTYAHRVSWALANGPIPTGLEIDHLCRNRGCVNPGHLEVVTHAENHRRRRGYRYARQRIA